MKTLVIGTGGREHALALSLARDPGHRGARRAGQPGHRPRSRPCTTSTRWTAPPSPRWPRDLGRRPGRRRARGAAGGGRRRRGPRRRDRRASGRRAEAARLEGSKAFAKDVMAAAGVPTARSLVCTTPDEAAAALDALGPPYVVKDDGLAAGKGVVVTTDRAEALAHAAGCEPGGGRGVPRRPGGLALRGLRRHRRRGRCSRRRTSSASSTAAAGPTPAAWAPTPRCPGRRPTSSTRCSPPSSQPTAGRDGAPRRALRRLPVRRPRADRRRPAGDRVQLPLRRPGRSSRCWPCSTSPLGDLLHGGRRRRPAAVPAPTWSPTARR